MTSFRSISSVFRGYAGMAVLGVLVMLSCARPGFPPGGPEDKTPPEAKNIHPEPRSTNVPLREPVTIEFTEQMNEETVENNLFISPIPAEWPTVSWRARGRVMSLDFPAPLRQNTTYIITIGAKAADRQGNPLRESLVLTFSTGAELAEGVIRGRVIPWTFFGPSPESVSGVDVAAYRLADSTRTPDPRDDIPDYVTQTGTDGSFSLAGVSPGIYRLFAIGDKDQNGFYTPGSDMIGVASRDVALARGDTLVHAPQIAVSAVDTAMISLSSVRAQDVHRVEVTVDGVIDSGTVEIAIDSLAIAGWFIPGNEPKKISIATAPQQAGKSYVLTKLSLRGRDGNPLAPQGTQPVFTGTDRADTTALEIVTWGPKLLTPGKTPLSIVFNRMLALPDSIQAVVLDASGEDVLVTRSGANQLDIAPAREWRPAANFLVTLNPETLRGFAGNRIAGQNAGLAFRTVSADTLGFVSGFLDDAGGTAESLYRLRLKNLDFDVITEIVVRGRGEWKTGGILPGRYLAIGHRDDDGDGVIGRGGVSPHRFAEPVSAYSDTIVVETGKTAGGVRILFP